MNDDETWKEGEVSPTLNAFNNGGDSRATVVTVEAAGGDLPPEGVLAFGWQEDRLAGTVYEDEVPGLTTSKTYAVAVPASVDLYNQVAHSDVFPTLDQAGNAAALVGPAEPVSIYERSGEVRLSDVQPTLVTRGGHPGDGYAATLTPDLAVRRLTPTECERLMGWPDGWTAVGVDEAGAEVVMADSSRYRQCGNGVASPVAEWVGRCIVAAEQELEA